jgi:hypothetical protein
MFSGPILTPRVGYSKALLVERFFFDEATASSWAAAPLPFPVGRLRSVATHTP